MNCRRLFCKFDHSFLFKKDNTIQKTVLHSCKSCSNKFKNEKDLEVHMRKHHEGQKEDFECENGGKKFASKHSFKEHTRASHLGQNLERNIVPIETKSENTDNISIESTECETDGPDTSRENET